MIVQRWTVGSALVFAAAVVFLGCDSSQQPQNDAGAWKEPANRPPGRAIPGDTDALPPTTPPVAPKKETPALNVPKESGDKAAAQPSDAPRAAPADKAAEPKSEGAAPPAPADDAKPTGKPQANGGSPTPSESKSIAVAAKPAETPATPPAPTSATDLKITGDWPMWGGTPSRNMVCDATGLVLDFDLRKGTNVVWSMKLGTQSYGNPVVAHGKVVVGTNNGAEYRPQHKGDRGVLLCFDEKSGELKWQLTREKLPSGQVQDWPEQGICSSPPVEGDRLWVVTNRCELMCVDLEGFHDGENDGPITDEVDHDPLDADIVWSYDMINELGVFPHNLATSSPVVVGDLVCLVSGNGVDEAHLELPSPRAPSFLAFNKKTGELVWENNNPGANVLHGQWSSPAAGIVNGAAQIIFPGGDGWLYAFDEKGNEVWRCDLNPKETKWELGGLGTRNNIIATPVFFENTVICGVGQDPEHGEGVGHLWRIDATKTGDISAELGEIGQPGTPNPNSGVIWHYGGVDKDGSITGEANEPIYRRSLSTVAVGNGLVFVSDLSGRFHCIDLQTGKRYWMHDLLSAVWGSPLLVDGKVMIGNEDGKLTVFKAQKDAAEIVAEFDTVGYSSILSTPTIANGHMFLADRTRVYCIKIQ